MSRRFDWLVLWAFAAVAAWAAVPLSAAAQTVDVDVEVEEPEGKQPAYLLQTGYEHLFETDIKNVGGADVSRDSFQAGVGGRFDLSESLSLNTVFIYELNAYDFSNNIQGLVWENINQYTLFGLLDYKLDEKWHLLGGPIFRLAGEGSAAFDDGFTGGGVAGFNYVASKDFSVGLGTRRDQPDRGRPGHRPDPDDALAFRRAVHPESRHLRARRAHRPRARADLAPREGVRPRPRRAVPAAPLPARRPRLQRHPQGNRRGDGCAVLRPLDLAADRGSVRASSSAPWSPAGELTIQDKDGNNTIDKGYDTTPSLGLRGEYRF